MHTHFASATHLISTFFGVLLLGTLWRLLALHALASRSAVLQRAGKLALFQY